MAVCDEWRWRIEDWDDLPFLWKPKTVLRIGGGPMERFHAANKQFGTLATARDRVEIA
jgi:hypothetical protein